LPLFIPEFPDEDQFELLLPEFMDVPEVIELLVPVVPIFPEVFILPETLPEVPLVPMLPLMPDDEEPLVEELLVEELSLPVVVEADEFVLSVPVPVVLAVPVVFNAGAVPIVEVPVPVELFIPVEVLPEVDPVLRVELHDKASARGNTKNILFIRTIFLI